MNDSQYYNRYLIPEHIVAVLRAWLVLHGWTIAQLIEGDIHVATKMHGNAEDNYADHVIYMYPKGMIKVPTSQHGTCSLINEWIERYQNTEGLSKADVHRIFTTKTKDTEPESVASNARLESVSGKHTR